MPNREKVIESLNKALTRVGNGDMDNVTLSEVEEAIESAITLLREQEARTMTLDELTEIYVEFKGTACPVRLSNFDLQKIIMSVDDGVCRLWNGKPTYEQMKAVKWNE